MILRSKRLQLREMDSLGYYYGSLARLTELSRLDRYFTASLMAVLQSVCHFHSRLEPSCKFLKRQKGTSSSSTTP